MMWSLARMVSSSCSTTTTVLPRSRNWRSVSKQPIVVARVQADRRLVQDVEHAHQSTADLTGQSDPLRLAAGERGCGTVQREVIEADVHQETEPAANLLQDVGGDDGSRFIERQFLEEIVRRLRPAVGRPPEASGSGWSANCEWVAVTVNARACGLSRSP